jgi:hypothetical protein
MSFESGAPAIQNPVQSEIRSTSSRKMWTGFKSLRQLGLVTIQNPVRTQNMTGVDWTGFEARPGARERPKVLWLGSKSIRLPDG